MPVLCVDVWVWKPMPPCTRLWHVYEVIQWCLPFEQETNKCLGKLEWEGRLGERKGWIKKQTNVVIPAPGTRFRYSSRRRRAVTSAEPLRSSLES